MLAVLIPVVDGVTALYGETLEFADQALAKVSAELGNVIEEYEKRDQQLAESMRKIESQLDKMRVSA